MIVENDSRVLVCRRLEIDGVLGRIMKSNLVQDDEEDDRSGFNESALNELLSRNKDLFAEKITDLCSSSTVYHRIDTRDAR